MEIDMIEENDWRLSMGQGEGMTNREFYYKDFVKPSENWDHEHCVFCGHKFMENPEGLKDYSKQEYCRFVIKRSGQNASSYHEVFAWSDACNRMQKAELL